MKTKERLRNQPPLAPPHPRTGIPLLGRGGVGGGATLRVGVKPRLRNRKTREQSENVYENKGRGQNSQGLAQTLPLNVCDAPKAQAGQVLPLALTVPSGHRRLRTSGVCAIRRLQNCRNKARMSMKTKERSRNQPPPYPSLSKEGNHWTPLLR
jgi:hypothetical protein